ncbi:MAG TPA: metal ABC transporter permease [Jatrophihabitantaceae bacterium]|nr:metal ABC transporter permease [Jatrophihabitantaceae bacterium]
MSTWQRIFDFRDYGQLLPLVHNSLIAGVILGVVCGLISTFVMMRDLPFAVHGISELSFAGAAAALLGGVSIALGSIIGSLVAAVIIGLLGVRARERNSIIGVLMPFGLGLGVLFLSLYNGRTANKFGSLLGQVVAVDTVHLGYLIWTGSIVVVALAIIWRPLTFASTDPEAAAARGVPVRLLSPLFMLLLGVTVAVSIPVVGALLVLSIVCTPAAAAMRITASPVLVPVLSVLFATTATVGGILISLGADGIPVSPYITTISFAIYAACRVTGWVRARRGWSRRLDHAVAVAVPDLG